MWISELWRYPVKSMGGEQLQHAVLREDGIEGDRLVQVAGSHGRLLTSRSKPKLLGHKARLGPDGQPLVDGRPWTDESVAAQVREAAGAAAHLIRSDGRQRFDVLPLLVATDGAIAAFGHDGRRLRPNLVIGGVEGLAGRQWPGARLRIGDVVIGLDSRRARCVMTTFDPDTQEQDVGVLRGILDRFGGELALSPTVEQPGVIRLNDPVELLLPG